MKKSILTLGLIGTLAIGGVTALSLSRSKDVKVEAMNDIYTAYEVMAGRPMHVSDRYLRDNANVPEASWKDFYFAIDPKDDGLFFDIASVYPMDDTSYLKIALHPESATATATTNVYSSNPALTYDNVINVWHDRVELLKSTALFFDYGVGNAEKLINSTRKGTVIQFTVPYEDLRGFGDGKTTVYRVFGLQFGHGKDAMDNAIMGTSPWWAGMVINGNPGGDAARIDTWHFGSEITSDKEVLTKNVKGRSINFSGAQGRGEPFNGNDDRLGNNTFLKVDRDATKITLDFLSVGTLVHTADHYPTYRFTFHDPDVTNGGGWAFDSSDIQVVLYDKGSVGANNYDVLIATNLANMWTVNDNKPIHPAGGDITLIDPAVHGATLDVHQYAGYFTVKITFNVATASYLTKDFRLGCLEFEGGDGRWICNEKHTYSTGYYNQALGDLAFQSNYFTFNQDYRDTQAFLDYYYAEARDTNNSVCHLLTNTTKLNAILNAYDALSANVKGFVDKSMDYQCSVGATIAYLKAEAAAAAAGTNFIFNGSNTAVIVAIALIATATVAAIIFTSKKKRLHR